MKLHYDTKGMIQGFYESDDPRVPKPYLEVSEAEAADCHQNLNQRQIDPQSKQIVRLPKPLSEVKAEVQWQILELMAAARAALADHADAYKLALWNDKAGRATRILSKTASGQDRTILQEEARLRGQGETIETLAQLQQAKAEELALKAAQLSGIEKKASADLQRKRSESTIDALLEQVRSQITAIVPLPSREEAAQTTDNGEDSPDSSDSALSTDPSINHEEGDEP